MKTKRLAIGAIVLVLILLAVFYLWGPGTVPAGQQPLLTLSSANFDEFAKTFDANTGAARLLLLVSPT